ncbi:MAG: helix-turn-helix transcriptional regulator [Deltaproteobacteria bacterium]|nr:helix-turn-helix transcriptional regulator [Deltaproteobacteria bacterium]
MIDEKMNRRALKEGADVSCDVSAKMSKSAPVSMESMLKTCKALECDIADVMKMENE